jgi:two-component system cell cycle response regulator
MSEQSSFTNATTIIKREDMTKTENKEYLNCNACLLGVKGDVLGQFYDLPQGIHTFGRNPENTFSLNIDGISRKHFQIEIKDSPNEFQAEIKDMGSSNGTHVNKQKISSKNLNKGDLIDVGTLQFKFLPKGDPERLSLDKMYMAANIDKLTECYNKAYFQAALDVEIKKCKNSGSPLTLLVLDLDKFKTLNDTYGHLTGDYVLKEVAAVTRHQGIREGDIFARYGGEEFVVLLPKTALKQGFEIAERIRKIVEVHKYTFDGKNIAVTTSIGVADYREGVVNGDELFKRADKALYTSKEKGRNQTNFFR